MTSRGKIIAVASGFLLVAGCSSHSARPKVRSAAKPGGVHHVVKHGESLYRIGKAYEVPPDELARANGIRDPSQIRVGQKIFIPGAKRRLPVEVNNPVAEPAVARSIPATPEAPTDRLLWPVSGIINSSFGPRGASFHDGIDIAAPEGTPVQAIDHGEVVYSGLMRGYGNTVVIRHDGGLVSVYAHNQVNFVREGQQVARGEVIARVGSTGRVTGPHLHFEIRRDNKAQDPLRYLPQLCCVPASDTVMPSG